MIRVSTGRGSDRIKTGKALDYERDERQRCFSSLFLWYWFGFKDVLGYYETARSVISRPLSMIANASRNSASVIQSGGFVKNVFQRTKVYSPS